MSFITLLNLISISLYPAPHLFSVENKLLQNLKLNVWIPEHLHQLQKKSTVVVTLVAQMCSITEVPNQIEDKSGFYVFWSSPKLQLDIFTEYIRDYIQLNKSAKTEVSHYFDDYSWDLRLSVFPRLG